MRLTMPASTKRVFGDFRIGAIEQLDVKAFADADGLVRRCRLVLRDVAIELRIDRRRELP